MERFLVPMALAMLASPAFAQTETDAAVQNYLPNGAQLETKVDGDLNGDGQADVAFLWRSGEGAAEERGLKVVLAYRSEVDAGWQPLGEVKLDPLPLGAGSLSIRKGVLAFDDLTGGTTATASTRRYRYDAGQDRMRLIGIDAERYSRTNSHGTIKVSWNLLDGKQIIQRGEPNTGGGDEAIVYGRPEHAVHTSSPIWIEESLDPDSVIDEQIAAESEDRD